MVGASQAAPSAFAARDRDECGGRVTDRGVGVRQIQVLRYQSELARNHFRLHQQREQRYRTAAEELARPDLGDPHPARIVRRLGVEPHPRAHPPLGSGGRQRCVVGDHTVHRAVAVKVAEHYVVRTGLLRGRQYGPEQWRYRLRPGVIRGHRGIEYGVRALDEIGERGRVHGIGCDELDIGMLRAGPTAADHPHLIAGFGQPDRGCRCGGAPADDDMRRHATSLLRQDDSRNQDNSPIACHQHCPARER